MTILYATVFSSGYSLSSSELKASKTIEQLKTLRNAVEVRNTVINLVNQDED
jgi:hypothetical protein